MENIYNLTKEDLESYLININDKKFIKEIKILSKIQTHS